MTHNELSLCYAIKYLKDSELDLTSILEIVRMEVKDYESLYEEKFIPYLKENED